MFISVQPLQVFAFWQNSYCLGCDRGRCSHCQCGARRFLLLLQNNRLWCQARLCHAVPPDLLDSPGLPVFLPEDDHPWWISLCVINSGFGAFWKGWFFLVFQGFYMNLAFKGLAVEKQVLVGLNVCTICRKLCHLTPTSFRFKCWTSACLHEYQSTAFESHVSNDWCTQNKSHLFALWKW